MLRDGTSALFPLSAGSVREESDLKFMRCLIDTGKRIWNGADKRRYWVSRGLDTFLILTFVIGVSLGMGSVKIGFYMISFVFICGLPIATVGVILKLTVLASTFRKDKKVFLKTLSSLAGLLITVGIIGGIYYIGKVMSSVG